MRQTNIFRTTKRDHVIPRDTMIRALKLSPGKDWCDRRTKAFEYLRDWALQQDEKIDGLAAKKLHDDIGKGQAETAKIVNEALDGKTY